MDEAWSRRYPELAANHFWWKVRRRIVGEAVENIAAGSRLDILDVGCGSGDMLRELTRHAAYGVEPDADRTLLDSSLRDRVAKKTVERYEPKTAPDVVLMLDVLEHIEEPDRVLSRVRGWIRSQGWLIVTVPAHEWLWTSHDVINQHQRRYSRHQLVASIETAGFRVERAEYLFPSLVVPKLIVRWWEKVGGSIESAQMPRQALNRLLFRYLYCEFRTGRILARGWPTGTSVMAIAQVHANAPVVPELGRR